MTTCDARVWLYHVYDRDHPRDCDCGECYSIVYAHADCFRRQHGDYSDDDVTEVDIEVEDDPCDYCDDA